MSKDKTKTPTPPEAKAPEAKAPEAKAAVRNKPPLPPSRVTSPKVEVVEPKKPPYYMADGKSITCLKGVLAPGDEVKMEYFGGSELNRDESLAAHVKTGYVIKS